MFMRYKKIKLRSFLPLLFIGVSIIAVVGVVLNIDKVQTFFGKASGTPANIIIDTQGVIGTLNKPWQNLSQGGEDKNYRFTSVASTIKALNPEYIRIDHIYDFYQIVSRDGSGNLQFDWTKFDPIISDILSTGAKPFISLSYMPDVLGNGDITGQPQNWGEWQTVIQRTIEHVSGRRGLNIAGVYYEVWNEPDLFGQWKTYGDKNYLTLYYYAAKGAQNASNAQPFKIGGPATTALYPNWITKFFDYAQQNDLPVDFYSWHRYHRDIDQFIADSSLFDQTIVNYPNYVYSVEKIISEWGHDSEVDPGYDSNYSAAHTVATAIQFPRILNRSFIFEIQDGKDQAGQEYWGRWGMLTHQDFGSKKKPRYNAVLMLSQLGNTQLSLVGQGSWVKGLATRDNQGKVKVILANYDSQGVHAETVPVTFQRINPGQYTITQQFLGRGPTQVSIATTSSALKHTVTMPASSVVSLELSR